MRFGDRICNNLAYSLCIYASLGETYVCTCQRCHNDQGPCCDFKLMTGRGMQSIPRPRCFEAHHGYYRSLIRNCSGSSGWVRPRRRQTLLELYELGRVRPIQRAVSPRCPACSVLSTARIDIMVLQKMTCIGGASNEYGRARRGIWVPPNCQCLRTVSLRVGYVNPRALVTTLRPLHLRAENRGPVPSLPGPSLQSAPL